MNIAENIFEQVQDLPEPLAIEVLDFVEFLKSRQDRIQHSDLINAQTSVMNRIWNNEEDEVWNDV